MWGRQVAALAAGYRVIAPDLRGFGASELGSSSTSLDQYADDLAALLDHLKLDRIAVVGLSMGGYISFAMLRRHRARIGELILADTRAGADTEEARQGREKNARLVEDQGLGALADQMLPKLLSGGAPAALRDEVRHMIEANQPAGIAAALRAMAARPDSTPLLATIDVPALIVVGSEDALTPPSESRAMQAAIAGSKLVEVPGAGHISNLEAPEAFTEAVEKFLSPFRALRFSGGEGGDDTLQAGGGLAGSW
jgi:pimeloyl-ACP methyl ester carboxylesterase